MLKLYDSGHKQIGKLTKYKDCKKESEVATGDATLSFTYLGRRHDIRNEYYVQTKDAEYVVKEVNEDSEGFPQIVAILNLEDLQRDSWESYSITAMTISEAAAPLLEHVGWKIGECGITKRRNASMIQVTTLGILQNLCTVFMCEPVYDNINKTVSFYEERGEDKGVYFMQGLNLRKLDKKNNSYDYYTQIIPIGADGLTIEGVNGGRKYLENYQYSNKVLPYIWKDESYTDAQALKEDAELKLKDLSRPAVSYSADVIDLAKQHKEYSILSYTLGDRVTLIDRRTGTREAQRIVRMEEYEKEPEKNTCELANTVLTFEELQERLQAAADIVNNTMTSDGKIHVSDILARDGKTLDSVVERVGKVTAVSYKNEPPIDAEAGDIWFDEENGNKPYQYDGETWKEEPFGVKALSVDKLSALTADLGTVTAGKVRSTKYEYKDGEFSEAGIEIGLDGDGYIRAKNFGIDENGNAHLNGDVVARAFTVKDEIRMFSTDWTNGATSTETARSILKAFYDSKNEYESLRFGSDGGAVPPYSFPVGLEIGGKYVSFATDTVYDESFVVDYEGGHNVTPSVMIGHEIHLFDLLVGNEAIPKNVHSSLNGGLSMDRLCAEEIIFLDHLHGNFSIIQLFKDENKLNFLTDALLINGVAVNLSASDIRLKQNVRPTDISALPVIAQIPMRQFDWTGRRKDAHQKIGFVADELEKLDARMTVGGGYNADGSMNIKSVDTFYLLGYAVKAIQELHEIVRKQAERIRDLQKEIDGRTAK